MNYRRNEPEEGGRSAHSGSGRSPSKSANTQPMAMTGPDARPFDPGPSGTSGLGRAPTPRMGAIRDYFADSVPLRAAVTPVGKRGLGQVRRMRVGNDSRGPMVTTCESQVVMLSCSSPQGGAAKAGGISGEGERGAGAGVWMGGSSGVISHARSSGVHR
jgi:hypothetical protein